MPPSPQLALENRLIGAGFAPLVIAEIGINHGGDLAVGKAMVDAAARAGAECVKFQCHIIDDEMVPAAKQVIPGNSSRSIYDIMQSCALDERQEGELKRHAESRGLIFLSTPFSRSAADRLQRLGVNAFKIGSGECNNYPLVEHVARFGKPMIVSTGMNTLESIGPTVEIMRSHKIPYALLHCTNAYPTPFHAVRLGCLAELRTAFPDAVIGLSDHTGSNLPSLGAIALGASLVERHFTDSFSRSGPDIPISMDGTACAQLISDARALHECLGGGKGPVPEEAATVKFAFASVVSTRTIRVGEKLTADNLWVKRPGTGDFLAEQYTKLVNGTYVAACDIVAGALLEKRMVAIT